MNYLLIRRILGILVMISGIISGILIFYSSTKLGSSTFNNTYSNYEGISVLLDSAKILLKGVAFGFFGICLALGAMVYKIGGGKESIELNLKEDKIEATVKYNNPDNKNKVRNDHSVDLLPGKAEENDTNSEKLIISNSKATNQKRKLFISVAGVLLILNIIFVIVIIFRNR
jgi:hypothetical protein